MQLPVNQLKNLLKTRFRKTNHDTLPDTRRLGDAIASPSTDGNVILTIRENAPLARIASVTS